MEWHKRQIYPKTTPQAPISTEVAPCTLSPSDISHNRTGEEKIENERDDPACLRNEFQICLPNAEQDKQNMGSGPSSPVS